MQQRGEAGQKVQKKYLLFFSWKGSAKEIAKQLPPPSDVKCAVAPKKQPAEDFIDLESYKEF